MQCMAAAVDDAPELGTVNSALLAVRHMQRVVRVKASLLRELDATRMSPIESCADALVQYLVSPHNQCRRAAMDAFSDIAPLTLRDVPAEEYAGSVREFLSRTVDGSASRIDAIFVTAASCALFSFDSDYGGVEGSIAALLAFMQRLAAALDVLTWLARKEYHSYCNERAPAPAVKRKAAALVGGGVMGSPAASAVRKIVDASACFMKELMLTSPLCAKLEESCGCVRFPVMRDPRGDLVMLSRS